MVTTTRPASSDKTRMQVAFGLGVVMLPLLAIGLLDPLEGMILILPGVTLAAVVRVMSGVRIPKLAWIPFAVSLALYAVLIGFTLVMQAEQEPGFGPGIGVAGAALLWAARLADLVMVAGIVVYLVKLFKAAREAGRRAELEAAPGRP